MCLFRESPGSIDFLWWMNRVVVVDCEERERMGSGKVVSLLGTNRSIPMDNCEYPALSGLFQVLTPLGTQCRTGREVLTLQVVATPISCRSCPLRSPLRLRKSAVQAVHYLLGTP
ncbi:hypothetical protein HD806DRAFT_354714 [Xylariaceae sp. AK1471]|nr:hypothetical protein HD806DRAFT_354714 [Xylariaceae sp. AK1471]